MNINSSLPIVYSNPNARLRSSEQANRSTIQINNDSNNIGSDRDPLADQQKQTNRVIRVASEGLRVTEFGSKFSFVNSANSSTGKASSQAKPEQQYQTNQSLLERDEIDSLIGIDLFA